MRYSVIYFFSVLLLMSSGCSRGKKGRIYIPDEAFERLSQYNFFQGDLSDLNPAERVLPYDLITPLFSDYAHKARFVWMPEGQSARYNLDHVLEFPVGTVLIKNFYYNADESNQSSARRILETRLLINRGREWDAYGYTWNESQDEAYYDIIGDIKKVNWVDENGEEQEVDYIIPNKNQCKSCHAYDNKLLPIGPKVRNINKDFTYRAGTMNQLEKWVEVGYLEGYDHDALHPEVAQWDNKESANLHGKALAYLDINCGHCHQPKGAGNTSGLTLTADSHLNTALGIYKPTVSAGAGTGGFTYSIVPGKPEESIMIYRMKSTNPGAMMPELGRRMIHTEGVALIADWINSMDPADFKDVGGNTLN